MLEARKDLERVTDDLASFVETNRLYSDSPMLTRRFNDLSREVEAQTAVWVELRRQLEVAKIDENKTINTVDVLDRASPPVKKAGPARGQYGVIGAFLGFVASLLALCWLELKRYR